MKDTLIGTNILVVEDDQSLRDALSAALKKTGATIFQATHGQEAWSILENKKIELVISDVQMPVMDGIELLKKIRSSDPKIPLVLLATGQSQLTEELALNSGASGLIIKPFKIKTLVEKITQLLKTVENL